MTRTHTAGALIVISALLHASCCDCDQPISPTVVATPTPTPTPAPTPTPCIRNPFPATFRCAAEPPPRFEAIVIAAQDQVRREHPEIFDGSGRVSETIYTGWLAQTLVANGHCAIGGTDDEISIKPIGSSEFSELYDVVTGAGFVWNNYVFTCRPSLF